MSGEVIPIRKGVENGSLQILASLNDGLNRYRLELEDEAVVKDVDLKFAQPSYDGTTYRLVVELDFGHLGTPKIRFMHGESGWGIASCGALPASLKDTDTFRRHLCALVSDFFPPETLLMSMTEITAQQVEAASR